MKEPWCIVSWMKRKYWKNMVILTCIPPPPPPPSYSELKQQQLETDLECTLTSLCKLPVLCVCPSPPSGIHWLLKMLTSMSGCVLRNPPEGKRGMISRAHCNQGHCWTFPQMLSCPCFSLSVLPVLQTLGESPGFFFSEELLYLVFVSLLWHRSMFSALRPTQRDNTVSPVWLGSCWIRGPELQLYLHCNLTL